MRRIHVVKLTIRTPACPRISLLCNIVYMLSKSLTLNTWNVMHQYIFQFREMCVATTQTNLQFNTFFLSCQPLSTPQNLSPARSHNPIYHPHKTINFLNKSLPSFGI